jgi:hypothetical protein
MSRRRVWLVALLTVGLVATPAFAGAGWALLRIRPVRDDLARAGAALVALHGDLARVDLAAARVDLATLQAATASARSATAGWAWRFTTVTPAVDADLAAAATVAGALDDLSQQALPAIVDAVAGSNLVTAGRVDLAGLAAIATRLAPAVGVITRCAAQIAAVDVDKLTAGPRDAVTRLRSGLEGLASLAATAQQTLAVAPAILGANAPRTYLVLLQNLAEVRATGGMPGSFIVIRIDHGGLSLVDDGSSSAVLGTFGNPVQHLTSAQLALYGNLPATYPADVNLTPDFATTATLAREMYRQRRGRVVDGVLATDPVALAYLLGATGPVTVPGGETLSASTAIRVLLSDVYRTLTATQQDQYFAAAARAVFDRLRQGPLDPRATLAALDRAVSEGRVLMWSAHPDEQAAIASTPLAGPLPDRDGARATVGVFLNDGSGAKLDYYLTHAAALSLTSCTPDGEAALRLTVTLGSTVPPRGLPTDVLGLGLAGDPYTVRTQVLVFTPTLGSLLDAYLDGRPVSYGDGQERQRSVGVFTVDLKPGGRSTLVVNLVTAPEAPPAAVLAVTPGVNPWRINEQIMTNCSQPR